MQFKKNLELMFVYEMHSPILLFKSTNGLKSMRFDVSSVYFHRRLSL